jgi:predicted O-methyltransferase YrrM
MVDLIRSFQLEKFALMIGSADAAQFFQMLIRIGHYKRCIEVGTLSGYTSMSMALAVPDDGIVVTLDIDDKYARPDIWRKAGVEKKINFRVKPAVDSLNDLLNEYGENSFDFIFIDGDKVRFSCY